MMRIITIFFIVLMYSAPGRAQECTDPLNALRNAVSAVGTHNFVVELKGDGGTKFIAVMGVPSSSNSPNASWRLLKRDDPNYCAIASGDVIQPLLTPKLTNQTKYGMPGSGFPRCSEPISPSNPLAPVQVRTWARQELGEGPTYSLEGGKDEAYTLLLSKEDGYWILLNETEDGKECYFARGENSEIYQDFKMKPA